MRFLVGVLVAALLSSVAIPARAADHKDAPYVSERPPADINDVYLFRRDGRLVVAMTVNPVSDRDFNSAYHFSPDALYRFAFDTNGDGQTDRSIDLTFSPVVGGEQRFIARLPGPLEVRGKTTKPTTLSDSAPEPVLNEGPRGIRVFAGQRDDPFFFDLVGFNRFIATGDAGQFRGEDSFAGLNTSIIVVELPVGLASGGKSKFGFSGFTYLRAEAARSAPGTGIIEVAGTEYEQFDRMGNPAVNTVFIPPSLKNAFNRRSPQDDRSKFGPVILETLKKFATPPANVAVLASVALPDTLKFDLAKPDGYPNGRQPEDDVIDILLTLVVGSPVGDGVAANDRAFLGGAPYFAPPHQPQGN
jgi:hypothetical protein